MSDQDPTSPSIDPFATAPGGDEVVVDIPADATPAELAAWTLVARVMLNLDETLTKP